MTQTSFTDISGLNGVYQARAGKLHCTALRLRNGGFCLYSPVAGLEKNRDHLFPDPAAVSVLLAPNHYHNKGLNGHAKAFPNAALVCSETAKPRLNKITGLAFEPLATLSSQLNDNQNLLEPDGLKTGELWVQVKTGSDVAWIVTDAFSAALHPPGTDAGEPTMLKTFPRYGIKDAAVFKEWVNDRIAIARPTILLSCHGSPVRSPELGALLTGLLATTL